MIGYFDQFPDKCLTELRTARFVEDGGRNAIPIGTYIFTEYFCNDLMCDCQRVLIKVFRVDDPKDRQEEVATISYTWSNKIDQSWMNVLEGVENPFLDPFHRQSSYSGDLMDFWFAMFSRDAAYADRLKRTM